MILINSSSKDALKIFQSFLPISVPVGIGCLLAALEQEGIKAKFIDEQIEDDIYSLIHEYVKEMEHPYIFGFSVVTIAFKKALIVSQKLKKEYPDSIILFGGIHPTALPNEVLSFDHIDVVVRGEGEKRLIQLYKCIKERKDFTHIDNLSYRKNGQIIHNKGSFIVDNLDSYPPFPYHLFTSKKYDLGFVVSSRGCPYECIFCSNRIITGKHYRFKSAKAVADELNILCYKHNKRNVGFLDDNFLVSKSRTYSLMEEIKKSGLDKKMNFGFQARGDNVNLKFLQDLYNTGFNSIFFGIETTSEEIMKTIKKGETVAQCVEAIKIAKKVGFFVNATFIYGLPGDSHQNRMNCVRFSRELKLDMVRYNNATPYPGTKLYEIAVKEKRLNIQGLYENFISVSTFIENPFKRIPFSYVPFGNTENEIRRDLLFSYFSFYFDFSKLKTIFTRSDLNAGWFNADNYSETKIKKSLLLLLLYVMLLIKFGQLFYLSVIKKETRISLKYFLEIFDGLWKSNASIQQ